MQHIGVWSSSVPTAPASAAAFLQSLATFYKEHETESMEGCGTSKDSSQDLSSDDSSFDKDGSSSDEEPEVLS